MSTLSCTKHTAQAITSCRRCLRLGTYGLFLDGPIGHWWYTVLDANVEPNDSRSTKAVLLKTAADQLIWAPVMTCVFFAVLRSLEGHPELVLPTIQVGLVAHFCCLNCHFGQSAPFGSFKLLSDAIGVSHLYVMQEQVVSFKSARGIKSCSVVRLAEDLLAGL